MRIFALIVRLISVVLDRIASRDPNRVYTEISAPYQGDPVWLPSTATYNRFRRRRLIPMEHERRGWLTRVLDYLSL